MRLWIALFIVACLIAPCYSQEPLSRKQLIPTSDRGKLQGRFNNALAFEKVGSEHLSEFDAGRVNLALSRARQNVEAIFRVDNLDDATLWSMEPPLGAIETFKSEYQERRPLTLDVINDVVYASNDLAVKAAYFKVNQGGNSVVVQVATVKDGKEISDNEIFYAPYTQPKKAVRFDKPSTSEDLIPPGHYWIWSEHDGTAARRVEFRCGDDGRNRREIKIPAP